MVFDSIFVLFNEYGIELCFCMSMLVEGCDILVKKVLNILIFYLLKYICCVMFECELDKVVLLYYCEIVED